MQTAKALRQAGMILFVIGGIVWIVYGVHLFQSLPRSTGTWGAWLTGFWQGFGLAAGIVFNYGIYRAKREIA